MQLSKAQATLLHTVESAASGAILTLLVGIVQYLSTHQLNGQDLLMIFGAGFAGAFGLLYKSVVNSPVLPQAEADTITEAKQLAQNAIDRLDNIWPIFHAHFNALMTAQKAATPAPLSVGTATTPQPTMLVQPSNALQAAFPGAATQIFPSASLSSAAYPQTFNVTSTTTVPPSMPIPLRSWSDTALTPAVASRPPRG